MDRSQFAADKLALEEYSKLLLRALGPYCLSSSTLHSNSIKQERILNNTPSEWASLGPIHTQPQEDTVHDEYNQPLSDNSVRNPSKQTKELWQGKDNGNQSQEYTVDHIARHVGNDRERKCVEWWYGYTARDVTLEPPENIT